MVLTIATPYATQNTPHTPGSIYARIQVCLFFQKKLWEKKLVVGTTASATAGQGTKTDIYYFPLPPPL